MKSAVRSAQFVLTSIGAFATYCLVWFFALDYQIVPWWVWVLAACLTLSVALSYVSLYRNSSVIAKAVVAISSLIVWALVCAGISAFGVIKFLVGLPVPEPVLTPLCWGALVVVSMAMFWAGTDLAKRVHSDLGS